MNNDIYYKIRKLDDAMAKALDALYDVKKALDKDSGQKMTFKDGKVIINGMEYEVANFTVNWEQKDE